jgi:hypothetical protein
VSSRAVGALAQWQRRHGQQAAAEALLVTWIERAGAELPATHYALGGLELELAELLHATRPGDAAPHIVAARSAFSELPAAHPSQRRLAALAPPP